MPSGSIQVYWYSLFQGANGMGVVLKLYIDDLDIIKDQCLTINSIKCIFDEDSRIDADNIKHVIFYFDKHVFAISADTDYSTIVYSHEIPMGRQYELYDLCPDAPRYYKGQ